MTSIPLNALRAFVSVVEQGSLGRAASHLHLTQPTLSRLIKDIEMRCGQVVFERHSRGMALTPAGHTLLPHARQLLFDMSLAEEAMDGLRGLRRGIARIGAVAAAARTILPDAIGQLLAAAPELKIEVLEAPDDRLISALADREIDLMIAAEVPPRADIARIAECRFDDDYSVFCAIDHPLATATEVTLDEALQHLWVMPAAGTTPRLLFEQLVAQAGGPLPVFGVETGSPSAMVSFVVRTRLLGWLPRPLLRGEEAAGTIRLLNIEALVLRRRFFVFRRSAGLLPLAAQRLRECLPLVDAQD
jgi:DNA-binding transcriptional LysR family regulator